jgi:hypothetical protein
MTFAIILLAFVAGMCCGAIAIGVAARNYY